MDPRILILGVFLPQIYSVPEVELTEIGFPSGRDQTTTATFQDEDSSVQFIVRTKAPHSHCTFTTPDGFTTVDMHCNLTDPNNSCFDIHTSDKRPSTWNYRYTVISDFTKDCGIEISKVDLLDHGIWNIIIEDKDGSTKDHELNIIIVGNSIVASDVPNSQPVNPGTLVSAVFQAKTHIEKCRFKSPDKQEFELTPGDISAHPKNPTDDARPKDWMYKYTAWNNTDRDCGIQLLSVHPADEGEWEATLQKQGKPDLKTKFQIKTSDFTIANSPSGPLKRKEGDSLDLVYTLSYPYENCTFTTSDQKELEPLQCHPEDDLILCTEKFTLDKDENRTKAGWTYSYRANNNIALDCGIRIDQLTQADKGRWSVKILSVAGEVVTHTVDLDVAEMQLVAEDMAPEATLGEHVEMVFRTDLQYDECSFLTPQGNTIKLESGLPTVFEWDLGGKDRTSDWKYSWFGFNTSSRDCGIKILTSVAADFGEWTAKIEKYTGTILHHKVVVKEGPTSPSTGSSIASTDSSPSSVGSTDSSGASSSTPVGSTDSSRASSSTQPGPTGSSEASESSTATSDETTTTPNKSAGTAGVALGLLLFSIVISSKS